MLNLSIIILYIIQRKNFRRIYKLYHISPILTLSYIMECCNIQQRYRGAEIAGSSYSFDSK